MHDSIKNFHLTLDALASECASAPLVESNVDFKGMFGSKIKDAIGWGLPRPMKQSAADRWQVVKTAEIDEVIARLQTLLENFLDSPDQEPVGIEILAIAYQISTPKFQAQPAKLSKVVQHLLEADDESGIVIESMPLLSQLVSVELPLVLAAQFPGVEGVNSLADRALYRFSRSMERLLDVNGALESKHCGQWFSLLGAWTRCRALANHLHQNLHSEDDDIQFEWFVRQSLKLIGPNRNPIFSSLQTGADKDLIRLAVSFSSDARDRILADQWLKKSKPVAVAFEYDEQGFCSEWGQVALLCSQVSRNAPKLGVQFRDRQCRIELTSRLALLTGNLETALSADGQPLAQDTPWAVNLWHQDEDAEMLELEAVARVGARDHVGVGATAGDLLTVGEENLLGA